ncbi:MAG: M15 family metallopeptidase [Chloroflexi bacterium]|nr:M15 family metallopeptidase [Chloroflexota bacterium]
MGNFFSDVIKQSPLALSAERVDSPDLLEPVTRRKVLACVEDLRGNGIACTLYETYRSQQRQEQLFTQGATQLRHVGCHHFGVAADIVMLDGNGEPTWDSAYEEHYHMLYHAAAAHGLIWGGDWGHPWRPTGFPDLPHVQRVTLAQQNALLSGVWYPPSE